MEITKWQPKLEDILAMDGDPQSAAATITAIQDFWPTLDNAGTLAGVYRSVLIHSLCTVPIVVGGNIVPKWKAAQLDPTRPLAATWEEFCLVHLGLHSKQASAYKRLWEVYHGDLGFDFDDLVACGMFKLRAACGAMARMIKTGEIDLRLVRALFGGDGIESASRAELLILLGQINQPKPTPDKPTVDIGIDQLSSPGHLNITVSLSTVDVTSHVDAWSVRIIENDAPTDAVGIREEHLDELLRRLRKF